MIERVNKNPVEPCVFKRRHRQLDREEKREGDAKIYSAIKADIEEEKSRHEILKTNAQETRSDLSRTCQLERVYPISCIRRNVSPTAH